MKTFVYAAVAAMAFTAQAQALNFKSGEVLGSDGQMHQGASPEQLERIVEKAIKGMLPKGRLGRTLFTNLKVYKGPEHPHEAQNPTALDLKHCVYEQ